MLLTPGSEPFVAAAFIMFYLGAFLWTLFSLWMIVDCVQYEPSEGNSKLIWLLIILFGMGVGPLIYFLVRRKERNQTSN